MKKILVYDIAAEKGGAKTVLDEWYKKLSQDTDNHYLFVTSVLDYEQTDNIDVLKISWTKKSWLHRIFCDYFYIKKVIRAFGIDEIISLQNTCIPCADIPQTVYIHNAIPFSDCDFNLIDEPILWANKHLIGKTVKKSAKKAEKIIVQTKWMKDSIHNQLGIGVNKIEVMPCNSFSIHTSATSKHENTNVFFYPATPLSFKNHQVIVEACKLLVNDGFKDFSVVFTFNKNDNKLSRKIAVETEKFNLPIKFVGVLNRSGMIGYYSHSVLLFPSRLETVGLPLLEAQEYGIMEIVANEQYAKSILSSQYSRVKWFEPNNALELANNMKCIINDYEGNK